MRQRGAARWQGLREAAQFLEQTDDILVLCHQFPDGDTLGSAFALCRALQQAANTPPWPALRSRGGNTAS